MACLQTVDSSAKFLAQGAILQEFKVKGHNIVLGFSEAEPYLAAPLFGETVGRVANRIKDGLISSLNGRPYQLARNDGVNALHGGGTGWGKRTFDGPHKVRRNTVPAVLFSYVSPHGEEGYPGTIELRVWYSLASGPDESPTKSILSIEFEVELVGDECEETVVNVVNHSYFHLSSLPTIEGTEVTLYTDQYLPLDDDNIPLGVIGTHSDIIPGKPFTLGRAKPDYDTCFIMDKNTDLIPLDTRDRKLSLLAKLYHPETAIHLEVSSTEPAFQFYTGEYVDIPESDYSRSYPARAGVCFEASRFINAVNHPAWRNMVVLRKGQLYGSRTTYAVWQQ